MRTSRLHLVPLCVLLLALAVAGCGPAQPPQENGPTDKAAAAAGPADYDAILEKYVSGDHFDYAGLKKNQEDLARFERFLKWQAEADLSEMSREEQIAFYINAYNSCCIKAILDHYPVHAPVDVEGFFDKLTFKVAGEELTISEIEYDRLIANYKDMRAHFAVVCADRGCLPLKAGAYTGESLDEDLEAAAEKFVSDERQFKVDPEKKVIEISKIFEWYGPKFTQDPDRPVEDKDRPELYVKHWVNDEVKQLLESGDYELKIKDWDWTVNEQFEKQESKPIAAKEAGSPADYDAILKKYVDGDHFDYAGLKDNQEDLARFERFLKWQAEADLSEMSREEQIAFYINAYNSCCIKAILDHYPVHAPVDVAGFFDKLKFKVAGEELTISEIEYDRLIANYKDMRAHFAVVCADRGCLPLKPSAYTGETLDDDLETAAEKFVSDERQFKVDPEKKVIEISKIFEWYGPKFTQDPDRPVEDKDRPELYLKYWADDDVKQLLESGDYKLKIKEWSWTLNESPAKN